jgi:hypothetical protein
VLAYGKDPNAPLDTYTQYTENDDASVHLGLTTAKLEAAGIEDRLIILDVKNKSLENLSLYGNYTTLPDLLSYAMLQADYTIDTGEWILIPGIRYMWQFDDGAGSVIGPNAASRKMIATGYTNPNSLDAALLGLRLDLVNDAVKFRLGYTDVLDKADIIAPWRGFPTGGFTRAMSQYNWYANTKSYMLQVEYSLDDLISGHNIGLLGRLVYQDFDDNKPAVQADSTVFTLDAMYGFHGNSNIYLKMRYGHAWGESDTPLVGLPGKYKADPS